MKHATSWILLFSLSAGAADSANTAKTPAKSKLSSQVYESENEEISFQAVVKIIREIQGETEVFFQDQQGFYSVTNGELQQLLVKSQQKKVPVKVFVNSRSRQILRVEKDL